MNKTFGAILLVAGTTIGAGILALPTVTGQAGLFYSILLFLFYWFYLGYTSLLILEVNLWMKSKANMISMAQKTLGSIGEMITWGAYLLLLYALTTAYLAGSGPIVINFLEYTLGYPIPYWVGFVPLLLIFGFFVTLGTSLVDAVNRLMMVGLALAFAFLIGSLLPHVQVEKLQHHNFVSLKYALSVAATSFGFHIIIPNLTDYLHRDVGKIKKALFYGSLIPLICYILWEVVTLGIIPIEGSWGIQEGLVKGTSGEELLYHLLNNPKLVIFSRLFAFFAIVTSFLGVSLCLSSCIKDGLHLRRVKTPSYIVDALTFIPPLIIALVDPRAFLSALEFAGIFGVIFLLAILPVMMAWSGRYIQNRPNYVYRAPGGKPALIITMAISVTLILSEIISRISS